MNQMGVAKVSVAKAQVVMVSSTMPMTPSLRGPCLSNSLPAMGFMTPMRMAPGMSTRPESVAE